MSDNKDDIFVNRDDAYKTLFILIQEVTKAIKSNKPFIVSAVTDNEGKGVMGLALIGGEEKYLLKMKDDFKKNNDLIFSTIKKIKKQNWATMDTIQKDDGSVIINFK
jgi:hypothetical protein